MLVLVDEVPVEVGADDVVRVVEVGADVVRVVELDAEDDRVVGVLVPDR